MELVNRKASEANLHSGQLSETIYREIKMETQPENAEFNLLQICADIDLTGIDIDKVLAIKQILPSVKFYFKDDSTGAGTLPAGVENNILRFNGTEWDVTDKLLINSSGNIYMKGEGDPTPSFDGTLTIHNIDMSPAFVLYVDGGQNCIEIKNSSDGSTVCSISIDGNGVSILNIDEVRVLRINPSNSALGKVLTASDSFGTCDWADLPT
jgi:hypothetical protein